MADDLKKSPQRFVVVDLSSAENFRLDEVFEPGLESLDGPPPALDTKVKNLYPWSYPIVFRSGPYIVYKVEGPMGKLQWLPPRKDQRPKVQTTAPKHNGSGFEGGRRLRSDRTSAPFRQTVERKSESITEHRAKRFSIPVNTP